MSKRLLITGGSGCIGTNLIDYLLRQEKFEIIVLDNESAGKREHISEFNVEFVHGDIRDKKIVYDVMKGVDKVIHLAADTLVTDSIENPNHNFDVNVIGSLNILNAAKELNINNIICASTGGAILGDAPSPVHEEMVPHPISPYGASKLCLEAYCSAYEGSYGLKSTCLRFSNVYGPRSYHKETVISLFFKAILAGKDLTIYGSGEQTRDYVYCDDISAAIYLCLKKQKTPPVIQLGTSVPVSLNQLVQEIKRIVGKKYSFKVNYEPARPGEVLHNYCKIDLAKKSLGYQPKVSLREGLEKTWGWFLSK